MSIVALLAATAISAGQQPDAPPAFRPGLLLQTWVSGTEAGLPHASMRLRRLELQAKGDLLGGAVSYGAMADLGGMLETMPLDGTPVSTTGSLLKPGLKPASLLKDLHATVRTRVADVQIGQAKIPVSLDGIGSSGNLLLPERSVVSTEFGDKRDLGIQVIRRFGPLKATAGLFARQTIADLALPPATAAPPRDGAVRVDLTPLAGLQLGAVAYGSVVGRGRAGTRDRGELDLRWETGRTIVQGELIQGADIDQDGTRRRSQGTYLSAGYQVTDALQPVVRLGYLDRDLDRVTGTLKPATQLDVGVNYATPFSGMRFQTAWSVTWSGNAAPAQAAVLVGQYRY